MKFAITHIIFGLILLLITCGCETTLDEDWTGFGTSSHFPSPYENNHVGYIQANPELLITCQECHGENYNGGSSGISCVDCHANSTTYEEECNRCHGNPAPYPDIPLNQAPGNNGAHNTHMTGGVFSAAVSCNNCHDYPASWMSQGHIDAPPAEVVFSGVASLLNAEPVWHDEDGETCSSTYCHGNFVPEWNTLDGTQAECGSCHSLPPPLPHYSAQQNQCVRCHSSVVDEELNIINPTLHVNGAVNN